MISQLIEKIQKTKAPVCVGLDPMLGYIPEHVRERALEEYGGAVVLLESVSSGAALFQAACGILHSGERRAGMEKSMASLGVRDASERIYQTILEILG